MANAIFNDDYAAVVETLKEVRIEAGLSQRQLARCLQRSQSHVCMIENRQRRVELMEFCRIAVALGTTPESLLARVLQECSKVTTGP